MGRTSIEWCDYTFNPWWGCTKVSPGCTNCYAETLAHRFGTPWGKGKERRTFGDSHWEGPLIWDRRAEDEGLRFRVFCASMADVFDEDAPDLERERLWKLIEATPRLDWMLLTKRPENHEMVPLAWQTGSRRPPNVWLGVSAEDQDHADERISVLLRATWPAVRFVSAEPLLGPIDLRQPFQRHFPESFDTDGSDPRATFAELVDWVIAGAESGPGARPMNEDWVRSLRDQCAAAGVPFFYKQRLERARKVSLPVLDGRQHAEWPG